MPPTLQRPPALTIACVFVGVASGLLLFSIVSVLGSWNSLDTQESLRRSMDEAVLKDLGVTIETAVRWARWVLIGVVPLTVAGMVFAVFAVRGDRPSRWFLTALCVLGALVATFGGLVGLLPAAMLFLCAFTFWSPDSRRWFDAVNGRPVAPVARRATKPGVHPSSSDDAPRLEVPTYDATTQTYATREAPAPRTPPVDPGRPVDSGRTRPRALEIAAWTTIGFSALVVIGSAMGLLVSTLGADVYRDASQDSAMVRDLLRDSDVSIDTLLRYTRWGTAVALVASLLGLAAGVTALSGRRSALNFLRIMAGVTIVLSALSFPVGLPTGVAAIVVLVQSLKPELRTRPELS
ncbi:MAG: hypothetical protein EON52_10905 [Actinomycetales bacterium]|nr:MAG: hypothetical protein EON52_10905 [Actinomycetales bacterium]